MRSTIHLASLERGTPPASTRPADRAARHDRHRRPCRSDASSFGGLIFVDVTVNGPPMSFILDTGAEVTVLNAVAAARKLALTATGTFATGAGGGDVAVATSRT